jgi:formate dehydrogenase iron-sulfur subunit
MLARRDFLTRGARVTAGVAVVAVPATARARTVSPDTAAEAVSQFAILYDSTLCVGCRACELACAEANSVSRTPDEIFEGRPYEDCRALSSEVLSYVTRHTDPIDPSIVTFGKMQCMHCVDPACAASCPVGAIWKTPEGPVVWNENRCLGCRYCMMACPYGIPRFEWDAWNPRIRKCDMCRDRQLSGRTPACVEACPTGALVSGTRAEMLSEAHHRIRQHPRQYVHHVYGEEEVGGTNVLHIAARPFEELGYRCDVASCSYRTYTQPAMAAIPYVINGLGLTLGAVAWIANRRMRVESEEAGGEP